MNEFRCTLETYFCAADIFQNRIGSETYLLKPPPHRSLSQEISMASSREGSRLALLIWLACLSGAATLAWVGVASASQGPGVAAGAASHLTQTMMAILVYGASALVVGTGLIGALRRQ
jgi:hypothetical protein